MGEDKKDMTKLREQVMVRLKKSFTMVMLLDNQLSTQEAMRDNESRGEPMIKNKEGQFVQPGWPAKWRFNALALHAEVSEALEWMPWKPWKKYEGITRFVDDETTPVNLIPVSDDDLFNAKMELVDCLCFLLNMWIMLGGDADELGAMHEVKTHENIKRQLKGY